MICSITQAFNPYPPAERFKGLGWRRPREGAFWKQAGGWSDCDTAATWSLPIPFGYDRTGYMQVPVPLPASLIQKWASNNGESNYGLLMRVTQPSDGLSLMLNKAEATYKPFLDISYTGGVEPNPPPPPPGPDNPNVTCEPPQGPPPAPPPALRNADGSCAVLPGSHFTLDVSNLPLHPNSTKIIADINGGDQDRGMHADFGGHEGLDQNIIYYGIPWISVDSSPTKCPNKLFPRGKTVFDYYPTESDQSAGVPWGSGRYPFPRDAPIEGATPGCSPVDCDTDRHVVAVDNYTCTLYEGWKCRAPDSDDGAWTCANGAAFNLSNPLLPQRPLGWTSADAAGLPIYPGLVKVAEVKGGAINHAIRFTAKHVLKAYAYPASHLISGHKSSEANPWMGMHARLSASFDCTQLQLNTSRIICTAMKKYGLIMADLGSSWFLTGEASAEWEDPAIIPDQDLFVADMKSIKGRYMEIVMPPGHCLCPEAACLSPIGVDYCPGPFLPDQYKAPEEPGSDITRLFIQRGQQARLLDNATGTYDGARDASLTTQYIDSWNENQGITYFYGEQYLHVSDVLDYGKYASRHLLRFGGLDSYLSHKAKIASAKAVLTFYNWMSPPVTATLQVCAITKPWVETPPATPYKGLGWSRTGVFTGSPESLNWTTPGAWADCDPTAIWSVSVPPGHEESGLIRVTLPLPASLLLKWVANYGAANYGLLMKSEAGDISIIANKNTNFLYARPALDIWLTDNPPEVPVETPLAADLTYSVEASSFCPQTLTDAVTSTAIAGTASQPDVLAGSVGGVGSCQLAGSAHRRSLLQVATCNNNKCQLLITVKLAGRARSARAAAAALSVLTSKVKASACAFELCSAVKQVCSTCTVKSSSAAEAVPPATPTVPVKAVNDRLVVNSGQALELRPQANDLSAPGIRIVSLGTPSQGGTVTLPTAGDRSVLVYRPKPGFIGRETINYVLGQGTSAASSTLKAAAAAPLASATVELIVSASCIGHQCTSGSCSSSTGTCNCLVGSGMEPVFLQVATSASAGALAVSTPSLVPACRYPALAAGPDFTLAGGIRARKGTRVVVKFYLGALRKCSKTQPLQSVSLTFTAATGCPSGKTLATTTAAATSTATCSGSGLYAFHLAIPSSAQTGCSRLALKLRDGTSQTLTTVNVVA